MTNKELLDLLLEAREGVEGYRSTMQDCPDPYHRQENCTCKIVQRQMEILARIDSALAEPIVDPVQAWKDANGYDDFLKAYSKIVDERNEAQIQANEAYNRGAQVGYESALKTFKQVLRLSAENMLCGQNGAGLLGNGDDVKEE